MGSGNSKPAAGGNAQAGGGGGKQQHQPQKELESVVPKDAGKPQQSKAATPSTKKPNNPTAATPSSTEKPKEKEKDRHVQQQPTSPNQPTKPSAAPTSNGSSQLQPPSGQGAQNLSASTSTDKKLSTNPSTPSASASVRKDPPPAAPAPKKEVTNADKQVFRMLMKLCVQLAKEQRERVGKFRKDERHCGMELYEIMGLDEDEFIAPPNELQLGLSQYRFPPPNMHLLRENAIDEATMVMMLGPQESQKRKEQGFIVSDAPVPNSNRYNAVKDSRSRRAAVSSEATKNMHMLTTHTVIEKTEDQRDRLQGFLSSKVLFKGLDARDLKIIFDAFAFEEYPPNERIFEQGDDGDKFYLIDSGRCEIVICDSDGTPRPSIFIGEGDTFGELGVMYGTPRAASVFAATSISLWSIDRDTYRSTIMQQTLRKRERYLQFIEKIEMLKSLEAYEKIRLADVLEVVEGREGWVVTEEGTLGDTFYIVEEGELVVTKRNGGGVLNRLHEGDYFGELALLYDQPRQATVTAHTDVRLVSLNRKAFTAYLGPLESILRRNAENYQRYISQIE
eukprot:PhM_4_TR13988/c0_g1_i1/m.81531/K04739/PRKAR; cAMP-dependent protein kinase regulator